MVYDRKRMLERAETLRTGRRWRKALALYRQLLAAEPRNPELHYAAAPLMARAGLATEAWESFSVAAEALDQRDEKDKRLGLFRRAHKAMPKNFESCRALARAERASNDEATAIQVLLRGAARLKRRRTRGEAIVLLRDAWQIAPKNPEVVLALAKRLARAGRASEALFLLDGLDDRVQSRDLVQVRGLIWQIEPSVKHSWRWFSAWRDARGQLSPGAVRARA